MKTVLSFPHVLNKMRVLFSILLFSFWVTNLSLLAQEAADSKSVVDKEENISEDSDSEMGKGVSLKEREKNNKKKKGKRNVLVQSSKEDDENIIMYLDEDKVKE